MGSYDVIVTGSGAGGGTLAHRRAPSGKRIPLLERGGGLTREPQNRLAHLLERLGLRQAAQEAAGAL